MPDRTDLLDEDDHRPNPETTRFEVRREAILQSATREILRKGLRGLTFAGVAESLGLVPTGIMYYFKTKAELAVAVVGRAIERFDRLVDEALEAGPDVSPVEAFIDAYLTYREKVERGAAPEIVTFDEIPALSDPSVGEAYYIMFRRIRSLLPVSPGETRQTRTIRTQILMSQIAFTRAWLFQWRPSDYSRVARSMKGLLMRGLARTPGPLPAPHHLTILPPPGNPETAAQEQFLRAVTLLINKEGYYGASVHRISASLNLNKRSFYHYNDNKDELVAACFEATFDIMWRAVDAAEATGANGLEVLVSLFASLIELHLTGQHLLRTSMVATVPQEMQWSLLGRLRRITIRFESILSVGMADGSIRPVDVSITAQMLTAAINAAADVRFWKFDLPIQTLVANYLDMVFRGLSPLDA